jgi:hypothetical protein
LGVILLGTSAHPASSDAAKRQCAAQQSVRRLRNVHRVNLQFAQDRAALAVEDFETLAVLRRDSRQATGHDGARKPVVGEMCAALAQEAALRGAEYFCLTNADILFTQDAIDAMARGGRDGYAFSRMDVDPLTGVDRGMHLGGVDAIAARPAWWLANQRRFRDFILGEPNWDQIYTSVLLRHANAVLLNERPLIRHVEHPVAWSHRGAFADYNGYLASLDSHYFTLWCEYHAEREQWLCRGGSREEHFAIQRRTFTRPWRASTRIAQPLRKARAWLRHEFT